MTCDEFRKNGYMAVFLPYEARSLYTDHYLHCEYCQEWLSKAPKLTLSNEEYLKVGSQAIDDFLRKIGRTDEPDLREKITEEVKKEIDRRLRKVSHE